MCHDKNDKKLIWITLYISKVIIYIYNFITLYAYVTKYHLNDETFKNFKVIFQFLQIMFIPIIF